jgi:hypothetical protein
MAKTQFNKTYEATRKLLEQHPQGVAQAYADYLGDLASGLKKNNHREAGAEFSRLAASAKDTRVLIGLIEKQFYGFRE